MQISQTLRRIGNMAHVRQVFGEPVQHEGVLVIPVASVWGTGGVGAGTGKGDRKGRAEFSSTGVDSEGIGTGFLTRARPLGVYLVAGGRAHWHPVVDLNRIILGSTAIAGSQAVAVVGLVMLRSVLRRRRRPTA